MTWFDMSVKFCFYCYLIVAFFFCPFYDRYDYLRITNSSNHTIGTYCGLQSGRGVLVTGSAAVLHFHTDFDTEFGGFDLSFSFYPSGKFRSNMHTK